MVKPPGPSGLDIFRQIRPIVENYPAAYLNFHKQYGDIFRVRLPIRAYFFMHPRDVKHILKDNAQNYKKGDIYRQLKPILGQGLVTSEGELWKKQRRLVAPEFHTKAIESFVPTMIKHTIAHSEIWRQEGVRDVADDMMALTLAVVGEVFFGSELQNDSKVIAENLYTLLHESLDRMTSLIKWPQLRQSRAEKNLNAVVLKLIRSKQLLPDQPASKCPRNVLSRLIGQMPEKQLLDEVKTLMLAGHETTSLVLSWTWYLLSQNPEAEAKLHDELHRVLGGRTPDFSDISRLPYTEMVLKESMRLYPPIPVVTREALDWDEIGGYEIPPGTQVEVSPFVTHRHPDFWKDPENFNPQRFVPGGEHDSSVLSYIPFMEGPRGCVGEQFAMTEAVLILATLAQQFTLRLLPETKVEIEAVNTLRPKGGLKMIIERRIPRKMLTDVQTD